MVIEADPRNDETVFVGGIDLFKSTNGGSSWSQLSHWYRGYGYQSVHADQHFITFANNNPSKMLFGNDGGIYYSANSGRTISERNKGYNVTQFVKAAIGPNGRGDTRGIFTAGAQDNVNQIFRNASAGVNSSQELTGGDGFYTFIDKDGEYMISTYVYNNIYRFKLPWNGRQREVTLLSEDSGDFVNPMDYDDSANRLLASRGRGAIKSINVATNTNGTLRNNIMDSKGTAFRASPFDNNTWYVGLANGKLLKLSNVTNTNASWKRINTPFVGSVSSVRFGATKNDIFVTIHNYGVKSVWATADGGVNWVSKEGNLPNIPVRDILQNPLARNEATLATQLGVWSTRNFNDANPRWSQAYNGMSDASVTSFDYWNVSGDHKNNKVIASTYGRGVFTGKFTASGSTGGRGTPTITCSKTVNNFPYNQGFESGFGWSQLSGDSGNWTRKSGRTRSDDTGPSSAGEKRYYMYLEASTNGLGFNASAILESHCFDLSSVTSASFGFKNHMYGIDMGTLRLQASIDGSSWIDIWTASGDKGNQWNAVSLDLSSYLGKKLKLRFVGKTGRNFRSDIAIDDLSLTTSRATSDGQAPTAPSNLSASNITQTEATLSWTASSDDIGVTGYNIYQGSTKIATVTETSYKVTGLKVNSRYTFSVKAIDKAGNESASSNSITVLTDAASVNYCTSKGRISTFEWIDYISFGGMTNSSRSNSGYGDYTDKVATVSKNSTNRLYYSAGFRKTIYKEYWAVWIDYNQDGVFSDDEKVLSASASTSRNLYTNIKIPSTALLGKTRMRVSMTDKSGLKSCNTFKYGEVEDYSINITSSGDSVSFSQVNPELLEEELFVEEPICYPNPVTDNTITIKFGNSNSINFLITDQKGAVLNEGNIPNNSKVDVSYLQQGPPYILKVSDGQKTESIKLK